MLESYLRDRIKEKDILIMTHVVLGYPSFEECFRIVEAMVKAGIDLMELQIPFSEPIADGPVILHANQKALEKGATTQVCLDFTLELTQAFDIPFLIMSYYNILCQYGIERFLSAMAKRNLQGMIIPDLPFEKGHEYSVGMKKHNLSPIFIFSPTTTDLRMRYIASFAGGFIYCVARKGVTGEHTTFSEDLTRYLARCRRATDLPLALGFGVRDKKDIDYLREKVEIAVIGTQTLRIIEQRGVDSVAGYIRSLRQ